MSDYLLDETRRVYLRALKQSGVPKSWLYEGATQCPSCGKVSRVENDLVRWLESEPSPSGTARMHLGSGITCTCGCYYKGVPTSESRVGRLLRWHGMGPEAADPTRTTPLRPERMLLKQKRSSRHTPFSSATAKWIC